MNILSFADHAMTSLSLSASLVFGEPVPSVQDAAGELIKTGVLGAVLVLVGAYAFWATREMNKAQSARVEDQKKVAETLIEFSSTMKDVMLGLKGAIDALKASTDEERRALAILDTAMRELNNDVENQTRDIKDVGRSIETVRVQGEEARRAHDNAQRVMEDVQRRVK